MNIEMVGENNPVDHMRYTRLHADGTRLWAVAVGIIRMDTLKDAIRASFPQECAVVGDVEADGLPDVILSCGRESALETRLYLTTGRTLTMVQEANQPISFVHKASDGWTIPFALCNSASAVRAAIYNVQGVLVAITDVMPSQFGMLVREVSLPQGLFFAVVGSCVVRLP